MSSSLIRVASSSLNKGCYADSAHSAKFGFLKLKDVCPSFRCADLAHPVERHLAKVEVASSSLVIRSISMILSLTAEGFLFNTKFLLRYKGIFLSAVKKFRRSSFVVKNEITETEISEAMMNALKEG